MSCLCSHLPTHSITAHPMVTIRSSDRQRLIQPYIHNYAWLLFAALALYSAHLASSEEVDGEKLDPRAHSCAVTLRSQCMQLVGDCLMKAHQGKGDSPHTQKPNQTSPQLLGKEKPHSSETLGPEATQSSFPNPHGLLCAMYCARPWGKTLFLIPKCI